MSQHLPTIVDNDLSRYLTEINQFPMLTAEEEYMYAKRLSEHNDIGAAHQLVTSHLRLVAKIAMGYRGYGLPVQDLIAEGNIGLMQAVKKFDPEKGFRLSTYAMWWIKAAINEYVLRSWSLVKMGTSAAQKKLFFNLKRLKNTITDADQEHLDPKQIAQIADTLDVSEHEVVEMDARLYQKDSSLNRMIGHDSDDGAEAIDFLEDDRSNQEELLATSQDSSEKQEWLQNALNSLNERERDILLSRQLTETPETLESLSLRYDVSKERIRQIEARAIEKLQKMANPN